MYFLDNQRTYNEDEYKNIHTYKLLQSIGNNLKTCHIFNHPLFKYVSF